MKSTLSIAKRTYLGLLNYRLFLTAVVNLLYDCYLLISLKGHDLSKGEFLLDAVSDQYFITYLLIPMLFWNILYSFKTDDSLSRIRVRRGYRYEIGHLLGIMGIAATAMLCNILISAVLSMVYQENNIFTGRAGIDIIVEFAKYFSSPFWAAMASALFFVMGFSVWVGLLSAIKRLCSELCMLVVWLLSYFSMVCGIHVADWAILNISLDKYLIISNVLYDFEVRIFIQVCFAVVILLLFSYNGQRMKWLKNKSRVMFQALRWNSKQLNSKKNSFVLGVVIVLNLISLGILQADKSFLDLIFELFMGVSQGGFSLLDFIRMVVINVVPIYLIAAYMQKHIVETDGIIEIRLRSKRRGYLCKLLIFIEFLLKYILGFFVLLLLICIIQEKRMLGFYYYNDIFSLKGNTLSICMTVGLLRIVELLIAAYIVWLSAIWLRNVVLGVCVYIFMGVCYFLKGIPMGNIVVFGISSMANYGYLSTQTAAAIRHTVFYGLLLLFAFGCVTYRLTIKTGGHVKR